jgi:hypothetical protein
MQFYFTGYLSRCQTAGSQNGVDFFGRSPRKKREKSRLAGNIRPAKERSGFENCIGTAQKILFGKDIRRGAPFWAYGPYAERYERTEDTGKQSVSGESVAACDGNLLSAPPKKRRPNAA